MLATHAIDTLATPTGWFSRQLVADGIQRRWNLRRCTMTEVRIWRRRRRYDAVALVWRMGRHCSALSTTMTLLVVRLNRFPQLAANPTVALGRRKPQQTVDAVVVAATQMIEQPQIACSEQPKQTLVALWAGSTAAFRYESTYLTKSFALFTSRHGDASCHVLLACFRSPFY